jgi:hypothetical protein
LREDDRWPPTGAVIKFYTDALGRNLLEGAVETLRPLTHLLQRERHNIANLLISFNPNQLGHRAPAQEGDWRIQARIDGLMMGMGSKGFVTRCRILA